jgi:hypothetical protein
MFTRLRFALLVSTVLLTLPAPAARADMVLFGLDTVTDGFAPNKVDPSKAALTFRFEETAPDKVTLTFDATNLQSNNFISTILFNIDTTAGLSFLDSPDGLTFFAASNIQVHAGFLGESVDAGLFNFALGFPRDSSQGALFLGGETRTMVFGRAGLRATDFLVTSIDKPAPDPSAGGFYAAARVLGIQVGGREVSGAVGANTYTVVPEPGSITLFAMGGLGIAAFRLRRRSR